MRQGQQNRRGRGRNNNNSNQNNQQRKGQNPLTRSFESNGPDVKLRGTPAHIAEKYMSLARDAQSSGDPVLAENYLQHAEHYNRIIMAYREQQVSQGGADPGYNGSYNGQNRADGDMDGDDGFEGGNEQPSVMSRPADQSRFQDNGSERRYEDRPQRPQGEQRHQYQGPRDRDRDRPFQGDRGGYRDRNDRNDRPDRQERPDRQDRFDRADRPDRQDRGDRPERTEHRMDRDRPERFERPPIPTAEARSSEQRPSEQRPSEQRPSEPRPVEPRAERAERYERTERPERPEGSSPPRRRERPAGDRLPAEAHEQPEFLRRPVRRSRRDDPDEAGVPAQVPAVVATEDGD